MTGYACTANGVRLGANYSDGFIAPAPELAPYIRRYCLRVVPADSALKITASAKSVVMLLIGDTPEFAENDDAYAEVLTAAPPTAPMMLHSPSPVLSFIGVEFTPIGYQALFSLSPHELGEGMLSMSDVLTESLFRGISRTVHQRLRAGESWAPDLDRFFARLIPRRSFRGWRHVLGFSALVRRDPALRVARAARELGVSATLLRRAVGDVAGLSPKQYATAQRMEHAFVALARRPPASVLDIAFALGMYDEAHFHHAFRRYAGVSPSEVSPERFPLALAAM